MNFSVTLSNEVLEEKVRGRTLYLALFLSDRGLDANQSGAWQEVSFEDSGYARKPVGSGTDCPWTVALDGVIANQQDIILPAALRSWGRVTHAAFMDAPTGGNCLVWMELTDITSIPAPRDIYAGDVLRFLAGQLVVTLS